MSAFKPIILGLVLYVVVQAVLSAMVTGTTSTDNLITTLLPLGVGISAAIAGFFGLFKMGQNG